MFLLFAKEGRVLASFVAIGDLCECLKLVYGCMLINLLALLEQQLARLGKQQFMLQRICIGIRVSMRQVCISQQRLEESVTLPVVVQAELRCARFHLGNG